LQSAAQDAAHPQIKVNSAQRKGAKSQSIEPLIDADDR
jgi:hypothetical protein